MKPIFIAVTFIAACLHYLMFRPYSFMTAFKLYFFVIHVGVVSMVRGVKLVFGQKKKIQTSDESKFQRQVGCAHFALGGLGLYCLMMGNTFEYLVSIAILTIIFHVGCGILEIMDSLSQKTNKPNHENSDWLMKSLYSSVFIPIITVIMVFTTPYGAVEHAPPSTTYQV
ncbi:hypothetical protein C9374_001878 [Naegleria lovaniensis]|uniref:Uncharacterized protein n=1 Tax=Naegleria lovaniensis TaxID=51637 RepID=A0AA88KLN4_NAELO|nr:uncharacterized protein C9374_001878 [Naegleria lovaniensis]KAG2386843.1 hypothetical protein C9374_001878 [Naegleria lovaniensis]